MASMLAPIPEETELIDEALAGDAEAFGRLYQYFHGAVYRYIYARVKHPSDAEDLTSQVFLKAWEALPRYERREARFASWLFRIAHNTAVDYLRTRHRERYPLQIESAEPATQGPATLDRVIADEEREHLSQAIARLPEVQRRIIYARFFEERSYAEIADLVAKSLGACRVIQHRALSTLNQLLKSSLSVILLVTLLFGGTLYASESAIPGDIHYPVKRMVEQTRLISSEDQDGAAELRLTFALRRLEEAEHLIAQGRTDLVQAALHDADEQIQAVRQVLAASAQTPGRATLTLAEDALALRDAYEGRLDTIAATAPPEAATTLAAVRTNSGAVYRLAEGLLAPPAETPQRAATAQVPTAGPTSAPPLPTNDASLDPQRPQATSAVLPSAAPAPPTPAASPTTPPTLVAPTAPPPPPTAPPPPPTATPITAEPPPDAPPGQVPVPSATSVPPAPSVPPTATPSATNPPPAPTTTPSPEPSPTTAPSATSLPPSPTTAPSATSPPPSPTTTPSATSPPPSPTTSLVVPQLPGGTVVQLLPPALALRSGQRNSVTVLIVNGRSTPITLKLTAALPEELEYVAASASHDGVYDAGSRSLDWGEQTINSGELVNISFAVVSRAGGGPGTATLSARALIGPDNPEERNLQLTAVLLP